MKRRGCIYQEEQRSFGKGCRNSKGLTSIHFVKGVGRVRSPRLRWVGEISYYRKRYRFRSTNYNNVVSWLQAMRARFSD